MEAVLRFLFVLSLGITPLASVPGCSDGASSPSPYGELETVVITVEGVTSEEDALEVSKTLIGLESVRSCVVSIEDKTATCEAAKGTDPNTLVKSLEGTKYKARSKQ